MSIRAPFRRDTRTTYHYPRTPRLAPLGALAAAAGTALALWRWRPFRVEIQGMSMAPALQAGDWAVATRAHRVARGDVVVLAHPLRPELELVKRVVGGPGDPALPDGRELGPDEWFVLGDNHQTSTDSRSFGPVSRTAVAGRLRFVYWPLRRIGPIPQGAPARPEGPARGAAPPA